MKVNYEQMISTDMESYLATLTLDESTKNITWKFLNCTNSADAIELLKCQKGSI